MVRIRIWIGSRFNDFVDPEFESGSRGQKEKENVLFSNFFHFYKPKSKKYCTTKSTNNKYLFLILKLWGKICLQKFCCVTGSALDSNSMTLWIRICIRVDKMLEPFKTNFQESFRFLLYISFPIKSLFSQKN
jgi:hypothetical protein